MCFPGYCLHDLGLRSTLICDWSESWALMSDGVRDCQTLSVAWLPASIVIRMRMRKDMGPGSAKAKGTASTMFHMTRVWRNLYRLDRTCETEALGHVLGPWGRCTVSCQLFPISMVHATTTADVTTFPALRLSSAPATVCRERKENAKLVLVLACGPVDYLTLAHRARWLQGYETPTARTIP